MDTPKTLPLKVNPTLGVPIYRQICEQIRAMIAGRRFRPGQILPSVRQTAEQLEINPMTVSKAYSILEREGLLLRLRGRGMAVAEPPQTHTIDDRLAQLRPLADQLIQRAIELNLTPEEVCDLVIKESSSLPRKDAL
jgi:GntR family transcriptional regulator